MHLELESAIDDVVEKNAERWQAVTGRSALADGRFFYGVQTTRVFCRPSCASRLPRRENVEFFETTEAARSAGYRACKRCRPESSAPKDVRVEALVEACRLLCLEESMQTRDVAAAVGLSASYFQRSFKRHLGVTPQQYRRRVLAERGRDALGQTGSVTESIYKAGYASSSRFYEGVGQELGMKPSVAKAGAPGEVIHYALAECSLGHVVIAWTHRGVCLVGLADSPGELAGQLEQRFPKASLDEAEQVEWTGAVVRAVEIATPIDIPIDIRGTAFQERVWQALRDIPAGETRTYSEIAKTLGTPSAARAVAGACGANSLAVLVPCHRVVRADGGLAGYRWGADRKRELLRREARHAQSDE
ncbi:MAG: bifunctional DNA-binding transcriptional regulator/O6-methylguanine-DNA methyltransferase Ada [Myxococcales bacterium]|nr:bifunctional DNA-binding transcriptional regulator/O6-methylguanine-DNA methyltransferase Ada [Myxococcales bacterium]